jgi:O-antigen/teichoic acid export membrane protein
MLARMGSDGRENALPAPVALPRRAMAGTAGAKALEALTLAGLVLLVPRALGPADYGRFAVALAVATGIATATGIGGPALFARVLGPLAGDERRDVARALVWRLGAVRAALVLALLTAALAAALLAPGRVTLLQVALVLVAAACGAAATLLAQLALGLERTLAWSLRDPLENGVIVLGALLLYPVAGLDGALAAIALGAASALCLGLAAVGRVAGGGRLVRGHSLPEGVLRFARLQAVGGALTQVVHRGAAPACALLGVGGAATGHAAIAAGAALALTYAVMQTTLVALPAAARSFELDRAGAEAALRRVAGVSGVVVVPACLVVALAAEPLLVFGVGEGFRDAAAPLRIALIAAALAPLWALSTQLAALQERPEDVVLGAVFGSLTFVVVTALALPDGGASGAAAAMAAGVAATVAGTFAALRLRGEP